MNINLTTPMLNENNPSMIDRELFKLFKFGMIGLFITFIHALIALALIRLANASPALGNAIAYVLTNLLSYVMHTLWSFSNTISKKVFKKFLVVSLLGLGMSSSIARLAELKGLEDYEGILLLTVIVTPSTFLLHRFWTYR